MRNQKWEGEESVLRELIRRQSGRLNLAASAVMGDSDEGADIVQEVWVAVWRGRCRMPLAEVTPAWLHGVMLRLCKNAIRRKSRRRDLFARWMPEGLRAGSVHQPRVEARTAAGRVWRVVAALPRLQREVLLARYLDGRSTAETAEALGRAEGTVKASLHRAVKRLRLEVGAEVAEVLGVASQNTGVRERD